MKVIVCGGRFYGNAERVYQRLKELDRDTVIVQGGATGAGYLALQSAKFLNLTIHTYHADWRRYGGSAGPIRNQKMLDEEKPDLVIAFPGGRGTADMVARALKAGIPVEEIE